jgi:hypothetical protein
MEGAVTLYFPPNYSYPTVLTAANLQILRAIKEGMEKDELKKSNENILSLLFLDKSYNLKPVYPGEEVGAVDTNKGTKASDTNGGKSNTGLIVGMVFLILIILGLAAGGLYYKKTRDEEFAREEERRRAMEELNAKMRSSAHSGSSRSGNRRHAVLESDDEEGSTTTDDDDEGSTTDDGTTTSDDGDGTTTSGDGTTTSGDDGTTTSDDDSTTSGSKETTTDSSDSESESEMAYLAFGDMSARKKKKQQQPRPKRVKSNIVYSGGDEASVMTGATGFHSVSSQRTVKMKNVNLPGGVNINMR